MKKTDPTKLELFESGQVWQMADSSLQIRLVGKTLVHYKHYRGELKRAPVSLSTKRELGKFLQRSKATLVQP